MTLSDQFLANIEAKASALSQHPVYALLSHPDAIPTFMEHHVFAVWDFMSLVKSLQQDLTCVQLPWRPVGSANTRFLINEIVLGEESDVDEFGERISHFELYLKAMDQAHADTTAILKVLQGLGAGLPVVQSLQLSGGPTGAVSFSEHTFRVIAEEPVGVRAAVFAFGREDLIPKMFLYMIQSMTSDEQARLSTFRYYLERHIEVDGGHHSHLAWEMTQELLGDDAALWAHAATIVGESLEARTKLWDSVAEALGVGV